MLPVEVHVYDESSNIGLPQAPIGEIHSARDGVWYRTIWFLIDRVTPAQRRVSAKERFDRFWLKYGRFTHITMMLSVIIAITAVLVYALTDPIYADVRAHEVGEKILTNVLVEYSVREPGDYAMSALATWRPAVALPGHPTLYESGWIGHRTVVFDMAELARAMLAEDPAECVCAVHYGLHARVVRPPGSREVHVNPSFKYRFGGEVTYPWFVHDAIDPYLSHVGDLVAPRESAVSYSEVGGTQREKKMDAASTACFAYCEALVDRISK